MVMQTRVKKVRVVDLMMRFPEVAVKGLVMNQEF